MASSIYQPPAMTAGKTAECSSCACPTCGGLECLCRPRFFAGQLLTDDTLNRLEHYIVEKNKLHNRYLHGWGVVCGLEVVCNPCNAVTVRGGYALSPCGEDIIVCKDVTVDVCNLINQCKDKRRDWECEPYGIGQNPDCRDEDEPWILTVRYDETSSRGITALKGSNAPACCSSCSCGGSSGCGCGCHGQNGNGGSHKTAYASASTGSPVKQSYRPAAATIAAQCEPTLTCEGYVFEVCKPLPEKSAADGITNDARFLKGEGAIVEHVNACMFSFLQTLPQMPTGGNVTIAALYQWCCSLKQALLDNLFDHPVYNCQLAQVLNFPCPDPNTNTDLNSYRLQINQTLVQVFAAIGAEYLQYCLCSAFLPPCPLTVCDPRVPLATITVRKDQNGNCRIVRICNLGKRRFVITFANLGYWFSFVLAPLLRLFRKPIENFCCRPFRLGVQQSSRDVGGPGPLHVRTAAAEGTVNATEPVTNQTSAASETSKRGFKAFAGRVWANRTRTVDEETLFLGAIGAKDEKGQPYLAETELANPFFTLMVNRIVGPLLARLPDNTPNLLKRTGTSFVAGGFETPATKGHTVVDSEKASRSEEIESLKARFSELQSTIELQSEMINELRDLVKPKE